MKPNKFSKLTQHGLTLAGQAVLIVITVATIFAVLQEMLSLLNEEMKKRNLEPKGPAILARYNPPWTLPFLRRNELMFRF